MTQSYLSIQGVSKRFGLYTALEHVSFAISQHEFICLLGPSGCGKSTLLRILAGLEQPTTGRIELHGQDITTRPPAERGIAMMFQSYALFPNLTVAENVAFGLREKKWTRTAIKEKVAEVLAMVDLEQAGGKYPAQLSGGQQQRVALARAIALAPDVLLLDEPLSALDAKVRQKLRREIRRLHEETGMTTIMVTHDQDEALTMADKIVVMDHGEVVQIGTPEDVYNRPGSPFVADFIGAINFFEGTRFVGHLPDANALLAIRPEHVRLLDHETECGIPAVVESVEFRGSFYRLFLQVQDEQEATIPLRLTIDLPAASAQRTRVKRDQKVLLELPLEKLLVFERDAWKGAG
ncbi:ABC transporter ATP-binding protein [Brevibacillus borstelensis]|jgi:iron(III) transport system ATP-binding protein|uniref:ABC transporter ATP-binding protein n=1 Tax=Brevibacillus borstelensis TaxID=45462 RepID=UPI0004694927|nr:ATP-binding cassette domain-containing protein [Brevibacillus borstelensis]